MVVKTAGFSNFEFVLKKTNFDKDLDSPLILSIIEGIN